MKRIIFALFAVSTCLLAHSQTFTVPKDYEFESQEDYDRYEQDIVKCVDWLVKTPINQQNKKREEANRFLTLWATGTKSFTITLNTDVVPFIAKSGDYLLMFIGGWSKYAIENKNKDNTVDAYIAAIETVISFYNNNKSLIKKDKEVEKFAKMKENGTLKKYIEGKVE